MEARPNRMYFTYSGIRVTDLKRSLLFYEKAMGMKEMLRGKMTHGGIYVHLKSPKSGQRLELNWYPKENQYYTNYQHGEELDHLAFWCDDVTNDFTNLVRKGAVSAIEPFREGRYYLAFVKDHDGIWIELIGRARSRKNTEKKTTQQK